MGDSGGNFDYIYFVRALLHQRRVDENIYIYVILEPGYKLGREGCWKFARGNENFTLIIIQSIQG